MKQVIARGCGVLGQWRHGEKEAKQMTLRRVAEDMVPVAVTNPGHAGTGRAMIITFV
jgi:hypothetical protein